jgi:ribosomal protein S18 acetylase RimI-like enzyme
MGLPADLLSTPPPAAQDRHDRAVSASEPQAFRWVPIRALADTHRPRLLAHLLSLDEHDRYLRFGFAASDEQIAHYVDGLDFARDEVFGIFNRKLVLLAIAHVAFLPAGDDATTVRAVEFGVSVLPHARGRGYGKRLFDRAVLHARNRGAGEMIIHALSENTAMLHIVRQAGAAVVREGGEAEARLQLPPEDFASRWGEAVEDGAAELDYRWKLHTQQVDSFMDTLAEARAQASATRPRVE